MLNDQWPMTNDRRSARIAGRQFAVRDLGLGVRVIGIPPRSWSVALPRNRLLSARYRSVIGSDSQGLLMKLPESSVR